MQDFNTLQTSELNSPLIQIGFNPRFKILECRFHAGIAGFAFVLIAASDRRGLWRVCMRDPLWRHLKVSEKYSSNLTTDSVRFP
ncbi:hypothetical protein [Gloeocapsopsis dulcis]|uniref:hypothetical protein n=1 Tax=Gloeocapsopsis dulcis TaxID=2859516 RepID=UPI00128FCD4B|nr:hypothetical protein [Gloeocapsopsis dulcis]WNN89761.1 hypothetical protein P0S91_01295 [Gloeocapsopsis dulcis]